MNMNFKVEAGLPLLGGDPKVIELLLYWFGVISRKGAKTQRSDF